MGVTLRELIFLPPEIADLAKATHAMADNHSNSVDFYRATVAISTWQGKAGSTAAETMLAVAGHHDVTAQDLKSAAQALDNCHSDAEAVANKVRDLLNYAAESPAVQIDEDDNLIIPPDTSHLNSDAAQQVAKKFAELQTRMSQVLADGSEVDSALGQAISRATGLPEVEASSTTLPGLFPGFGPPPLARGQVRSLGSIAGTGANPPIDGIGAADLGEPIVLPDGRTVMILGDSYSGDKQGDGTHYPSVAVPVTYDAEGRPHFGAPLTGPEGSPNVLFPLPQAAKDAGANNTLPAGSIKMNDGSTIMMVVGTNTNEGLPPKGGSWFVRSNNNPAGGWPEEPNSYKSWQSVSAPLPDDQNRHISAPGTPPNQISGFQAADGQVYIAADSFDRSQGVSMYRVDAADVTNRDAWHPWTGHGWGNPGQHAAPVSGNQNFGELSFREVDGRPVLSGFNASTGNTEVRVANDPTKMFDASTPRTIVAPGGHWDQPGPGRYPQNYGGYIVPGTPLNNLGVVVSQWNTKVGAPYTVEQFQVNPFR